MSRRARHPRTAAEAPPRPDVAALRQAFSRFPTGVAVVTTTDAAGAPVGLTVSSFNTVSLEPPLVLWSLSLRSTSLPAFRAGRGFAINILARGQMALCRRFSQPVADRFAGVDWQPGPEGLPLIAGCVARLACRNWERREAGDHEIYIGEVLACDWTGAEPLVFGLGGFGSLSLDFPPDGAAG